MSVIRALSWCIHPCTRVGSIRSIIQRKVLSPNDCTSLDELIERIIAFGHRYSALGRPFAWRFTRQDLERRLRDPLLQPELVTPLANAA